VYIEQLIQTTIQEIYLQVKTPAGHILIKIHEVWVVVYILELGYPTVMFAQHLRQRGLSRADIPCYSYMFWFLCFGHKN
jgi:hypothetical protein